MKLTSFFLRKRVEVPCTVEIINTFDALGAHVRFDDGTVVHPGDEVLVHGAPVAVPYGQSESFKRRATITRASGLERAWTRATGDLELMELCEFSFSERAAL
jgi:hypothetical protein